MRHGVCDKGCMAQNARRSVRTKEMRMAIEGIVHAHSCAARYHGNNAIHVQFEQERIYILRDACKRMVDGAAQKRGGDVMKCTAWLGAA